MLTINTLGTDHMDLLAIKETIFSAKIQMAPLSAPGWPLSMIENSMEVGKMHTVFENHTKCLI